MPEIHIYTDAKDLLFCLHFKEPSVQFSNSLVANIWQTPYSHMTPHRQLWWSGHSRVEGERLLGPEVSSHRDGECVETTG